MGGSTRPWYPRVVLHRLRQPAQHDPATVQRPALGQPTASTFTPSAASLRMPGTTLKNSGIVAPRSASTRATRPPSTHTTYAVEIAGAAQVDRRQQVLADVPTSPASSALRRDQARDWTPPPCSTTPMLPRPVGGDGVALCSASHPASPTKACDHAGQHLRPGALMRPTSRRSPDHAGRGRRHQQHRRRHARPAPGADGAGERRQDHHADRAASSARPTTTSTRSRAASATWCGRA